MKRDDFFDTTIELGEAPALVKWDNRMLAITNQVRNTGMIGAVRPWNAMNREFLAREKRRKKEQVLGDPEEWIQKCLSCDLPECINCLHHSHKRE
jgi:hypothetical protein